MTRRRLKWNAIQWAHVIRQARDRAGLTQHELANVLETSQTQISRWENAHFRPSPMAQRKIERWLGWTR